MLCLLCPETLRRAGIGLDSMTKPEGCAAGKSHVGFAVPENEVWNNSKMLAFYGADTVVLTAWIDCVRRMNLFSKRRN